MKERERWRRELLEVKDGEGERGREGEVRLPTGGPTNTTMQPQDGRRNKE